MTHAAKVVAGARLQGLCERGLLRVLRVLKLVRHNMTFRVFLKTMVNSAKPLSMLLFVLMLLVILFSSVVYYVETAFHPGGVAELPYSAEVGPGYEGQVAPPH